MSHQVDRSREASLEVLGKSGVFALVAGAIAVVATVIGADAFTPSNEGDPVATSSATHGVVFLAGLGLLGLIELALGVIALVAKSRFPHVSRLSDANDALGFTAGVTAFGVIVALIVLAAGMYGAIVAGVLAVVLVTTSRVRKATAAARQAAGA